LVILDDKLTILVINNEPNKLNNDNIDAEDVK